MLRDPGSDGDICSLYWLCGRLWKPKTRHCRVIYSRDRALYWYFLWMRTCSNAEWEPINRDEIISHIDTADLPLYWLGSCGLDSEELNCKMWNWISIFLTISPFSPLMAVCRDFANTVNCVDKSFTAPVLLISQSRIQGEGSLWSIQRTMVTCDSGVITHRSVDIPRLNALDV